MVEPDTGPRTVCKVTLLTGGLPADRVVRRHVDDRQLDDQPGGVLEPLVEALFVRLDQAGDLTGHQSPPSDSMTNST